MQVCSALHQRYADFAPALAASLPRAFTDGGCVGGANLSRSRAVLRLLAELVAAGVITELAPVLGEPGLCCTPTIATDCDHVADSMSILQWLVSAVR